VNIYLRVWGCLAYVFIQKDKRHSLEPHMEQCVFVGYPSGYKGWMFYNPSTKKYIISECAEFDECVFPGLAKYTATSQLPLYLLFLPHILIHSLIWGGDGDVDDHITATLPPAPVPELPPAPLDLPDNLPLPQLPPALPPIPPHIPDPPRRTQCISRPPGEWKVKHPAEPEAEPPVIWSDDEEDPSEAQHANLVDM
jgi:hypothetical protein